MQFMVAAEYARVYENNQVIAKPPVKMSHEATMGSQLHSFYNDIACIDKKNSADLENKEKLENRIADATALSVLQSSQGDTESTETVSKEKKKKKVHLNLKFKNITFIYFF